MLSYQSLLRDILSSGKGHEDRTGVGTISLFGYQWSHDMTLGFPLLTTKFVPLRVVFEELMWFLRGSTNNKELIEKNVHIWDEWATPEQCAKFGRDEGDLGPVYGSLWRRYPVGESPDDMFRATLETVDQIRQLYDDMEKSPNSRRLIVNGWHPYFQKRVALPPCHTLFQIKIDPKVGSMQREEISLRLDARSIDSFLGLPFNIASYALLLKLLACTTDRVSDRLVIQFGDLHIYRNHMSQVEEQLSRTPYTLPIVHINDRLRGKGFDGLMSARWEDVQLLGYSHHPKISAPVAV